MGIFKAGNPAFSEKTFQNVIPATSTSDSMTIAGSVKKFGLMLLMLIVSASLTWDMYLKGENVMPWAMGGVIGGLILALIIIFKRSWAPYLALGYALCEGLFLGAISVIIDEAFATKMPGIVLQAVMLTMGVALVMFALYYFRILQATPTFTKIVVIATAAIALVYLVSLIMHMFGVTMPYLHSNGLIGIGISVVIVAVAALNLILDFDLIERGSRMGAPKYMEWYGAFGLMVTIVWLYLEILKLLSKFASRR